MSHTRLFRFNLILLVVGLIIAPWQPVVAMTPNLVPSIHAVSALAPQADPIYVDADAPGPLHDGLSWTTAYTDLQTALITATPGSEIWVAEGIYTPGDTGDRTATFHPPWNAALYGGFAGTETALSERDWVAHPTVLSGDLERNDITTPSGVVTDTANITGTNAYHVMTFDYNTTVDGFIITAGQATGAYPDENGGGVLNNGSPTLSNVVLSGNMAQYSGGGIYGYGSLTLISVTVSNNQAGSISPTGYGGGMYIHYGAPTLTDVTFSNNQAYFGGAMYNTGSPTLNNVTFDHNLANYGYGGGLYNYGYLSLVGVTFSNNRAGYDGGGMYNKSPFETVNLNDAVFDNNLAEYGYGGGMYTEGGVALTDVIFSNNHAQDGGGGMNTNSPNASSTLTNVTFINNQVQEGSGGGMANTGGSPTLFNVGFIGNSATGYGGGGGMFNDGSDPILTNVTFYNNQTNANGGGMDNFSSDPALVNVTFSNNQAGDGGGMYNSYSSPTLVTVTFTSNLAGGGGGMFNARSSPTLTNVIFSNNQAYYSGGGMENDWDSNTLLTNVTFSGNSAYDGGGMRNFQSSPTLNNVILNGNQVIGNGGGMVNEEGSHPTLINTTFSGNQAGYGGGGIYNADSNPTLINCISWGNDASADPEIRNVGTSVPNVTYSDVYWANGVYTGTGNLSLDPQFVSPVTATVAPTTTGDYHLLPTSPVIDAGNNFSVTVSTDRDGNSRRMNVLAIPDTGLGTPPIVDMGAYEVENTSVTLTLNSIGDGVITSTPPGSTFVYGTIVTFTATPGTGSTFIGWSGDLGGMTNPVTLTMDADKNITGTFALNTYTLALNTIGNGTIAGDPPGSSFVYGTVVTLTATPGTGSSFTGWSGDLSSTTNPITFTIDANRSVTATFALNTYTLTLNTVGNGTIANEPSGSSFAYGTVVTLTATHGAGSAFAGWSGDFSGTTNPITLTMDADKSITGTFTLNTYTLTLNTIGNGTITSEPSGSTFAYGTVVTLTALPGTSSAFAGWSGDLGGTTNPITLTMDANKIVTAIFQWRTYLPLVVK